MSEKKENTPKSFLEMGNFVKESQIDMLDFVVRKKYNPSTDDAEYNEELKIMLHMFFGSLKMITCCYSLFDKVDLLKNHKNLDILELINQLHSDIQRKIEEKT